MFLVEVSFRDQCRRIILVAPYSFQLLIFSALERFGVSATDAGLRYMDPHDKDWITLSTDQELVEALSLVNFEPPVLHMELFLRQSTAESEIGTVMSQSEEFNHAQKGPEAPDICESQADDKEAQSEISTMDIQSKRIDSNEQCEGGPSDAGKFTNEEESARNSRALGSTGDSRQESIPLDCQYEDVVVVDDSARQTDEALARLMDMGFDNTAQLEVLLRVHGGDVDAVLEALLSD